MRKRTIAIISALIVSIPFLMGITSSTFVAYQVSDFNSLNSQVVGIGVQGSASLNTTTNVDLAVADDSYVLGGVLLVNGGSWGDYLDLKVVDKDNILGFGANFVVKTVVTNFYVATDRQLQSQFSFQIPASKIPGGLYIRLVYHSTAIIGSPAVAMNYFFQKVLY